MNKIMKKIFVLIITLFCISGVFALDMSTAQAKKYREQFVEELKKYVGCPYEFGAVGPKTFDCSGLVNYAASKAIDIQLPRTARAMYSSVTIIPAKKREVGDLLFFKTTGSDSISHVGVYIGNDQFISAISDGPNTGVIVSSLNQDYWKPKYVATGQFLPSGNLQDEIEEEIKPTGKQVAKADKTKTEKTEPKKENTLQTKPQASSYRKKDGTFADNFVMDASLFIDWTLLSSKSFSFQFRGVDLNLNARYANWDMEPGLGMTFRYNYGLGLFQMPTVISLTINDFFRAYAGPVFSFGNATLPGTTKKVSPSIFPGVIGVTFTTDSLILGKCKLQFAQDISYTVYNNEDKSALPLLESLSSGLIFYTGVKISLPLSSISGK